MLIGNSVNRQEGEERLLLFAMEKFDIDGTIQANLRRLMEEREMQQNTLAKKIGVVPSVINDILAGRRAMGKDTMMRLCRALSVQPWEFYWTQDVPIVKDNYEREMMTLARQAREVGVAEDLAEYAVYRINKAAPKDAASGDALKGKRKILTDLYGMAVKQGRSGEIEKYLEKITENKGVGRKRAVKKVS